MFDLFRAAALQEFGPGCYVVKTPRKWASSDVAMAMLGREAMIAESVQHASLICVFAAQTRGPEPYLMLPFHDGMSLRQLIHTSKACMTVSRVLSISRQVAEALSALHAAGWLHGQLRPEHVLLSPHGHATVVDLTQARRLETVECDSGNIVPGDATYDAPEMAVRCRRLSSAADVYALGAMLYEILAGQPLFAGSSPRVRMEKHRCEAVSDIRELRPDVTRELAHLLRLMLAKEALRRPTDGELVKWLAELEIAALAV